MDEITSRSREPDPDPDSALVYSQAFFDECAEAAIEIVDRSYFEARLRAQLKQGDPPTAEQDPAWYALRNIVYASGWRQAFSKRSGFRYDDGLGWKYFMNAYSVLSELLYCRSNLLAVQALNAMVSLPLSCDALESALLTSHWYKRVSMRNASAPLPWTICYA